MLLCCGAAKQGEVCQVTLRNWVIKGLTVPAKLTLFTKKSRNVTSTGPVYSWNNSHAGIMCITWVNNGITWVVSGQMEVPMAHDTSEDFFLFYWRNTYRQGSNMHSVTWQSVCLGSGGTEEVSLSQSMSTLWLNVGNVKVWGFPIHR